MDSIETLEVLARGVAVGAFLGVAIICARRVSSPAGLTAVLFCLAAAAHTLTQLPSIAEALGWAIAPVWAFSVMGAGLFWAFALELFEDRAKLDLSRFAPAVFLLAIGMGAALTAEPMSRAFLLVHNLAGAALIAHALIRVAAGWRGDLVETRRRLRGPVLAAGKEERTRTNRQMLSRSTIMAAFMMRPSALPDRFCSRRWRGGSWVGSGA